MNSRRVAARFVLCFLCGLATASQAADRALVVGVEIYAHPGVPPTAGCERDARETARFLVEKLGFSKESVRVLVNKDATAARIQDEFRSWLIDGSRPGDRVFFSYSGHGSRLKRSDGSGDYHNTLAPFDVDPRTGENQLLDVTLRDLVNQLSNRRGVLVFDACHSGSISRSLAKDSTGKRRLSGRYLPPPEEFIRFSRNALPGGSGTSFVVGDASPETPGSRSVGNRDIFLESTMESASTGIVAFSAAADDQVAYPFQTGAGSLLGALTGAFLEAAGDGKVPVGEVKKRILDKVARLQRSGELLGRQVPQFDVRSTDSVGLERLPLFGSWQTEAVVALQNPAGSRRFSIRMVPKPAGQPYLDGDVFAFHLELDRPGHVYILSLSPDRKAALLFPNQRDRQNLLPAGEHQVPRKGEEFFVQCPTGESCGKERVVALVSGTPLRLGEKPEYSWAELYERVPLRELRDQLSNGRGPGIRPSPAALDWQSASVEFESRKK